MSFVVAIGSPKHWLVGALLLLGGLLVWRPCDAQESPVPPAEPPTHAPNGTPSNAPQPSLYDDKMFGAGLRIGSPYLLEIVGLYQPIPHFQVGLRASSSLKLWSVGLEAGGALVIRPNQRLHVRAGASAMALWSRECTETLPSTCDPNGGLIIDAALGWSYLGDWLELRIDAGIIYLDWMLDGTQADDFEERELAPMFSLTAMKWW